MYYTRSYLYCRCICGRFSLRRRLPDVERVATPLVPNRLRNILPASEPSFAALVHHRLKWLPYQRPWHVATEKPQERPRTFATFAKVWQLSVEWTSLTRGISLYNRLHKWRAPAYSSEQPSQTAYLYEAAVFAYSLQPLLAACVVDGARTCYCTEWFCCW